MAAAIGVGAVRGVVVAIAGRSLKAGLDKLDSIVQN